MTEPEPTISERIAALDARRIEMGVSVERLTARAGYKSDQTWRDLPKRPESTLAKFEKALDWIEEHADESWRPETDLEPPTVATQPNDLIELEVTGDFGVRVVVKAPVGNADELERFASRLIRDIRAGKDLD